MKINENKLSLCVYGSIYNAVVGLAPRISAHHHRHAAAALSVAHDLRTHPPT